MRKKLLALFVVCCCLFCMGLLGCEKNGEAPSTGSEGGGTEQSITYTVTYDANGGAFADGLTSFIQEGIEKGAALSAPSSPNREGYTFAGWAKDNVGQTMWQFATDKVSGDITLYAVWTQRAATILSVDNASINGTDIFMLVEMDITGVSLANKIVCTANSYWKLYYDRLGQMEIPTKIAAGQAGVLDNGANIFYLVVSSADQTQVNVYELTIHRKYPIGVFFYDGASLLNTEIVATGEEFSATYTPSINGYTFHGWKTAEGSAFSAATLWEPLALYAEKTANTYTVTYDENGGDALTTESKQVTYGEPFALAVPTRTGYSFEGWSYGSTMVTDRQGQGVALWGYANNMTLRAKWTANPYEVTLNKSDTNAGTVTGGGTHTYDSRVTISASTNAGYTWLGWYDGEDNLVSENTSYTFTMGFSTEYTAKWTYYTLTTIQNNTSAGRITTYTNEKVTQNRSITITATTNAGYTFVGWYDGEELLSESLSYTFAMPAKDITYQAKWSKVTVERNNSAAGSVTALTGKYKVGDNVEITANTNAGYTFVGWYCGTELLSESLSYTFAMPAKDITYQAKWKANTYTVSFVCSEVEIGDIEDITVTYDSTYGELPSITRAGYTFDGWYTAETGGTRIYSTTVVKITQNQTLYAKGTTDVSYSLQADDSYQVTGLNSNKKEIAILDSYNGKPITSIKYRAFVDSTSLISVVIGNNITAIGNSTFESCTNLRNIVIGNSVTTIEEAAFRSCTSLTSIEIPDSVTEVKGNAFLGCDSLQYATHDNAKYLGNSNNPYVVLIHSINDSITSCNIHQDTKVICDEAFQYSGLTSIVIPNSVTTIGKNAFMNSKSLTSVEMGNGVTTIGNSAFSGCEKLTSVEMGNGVTMIAANAFSFCTSLTSIGIPDSVTTIWDWAFGGCISLTSVEMGNGVTTIGSCAFLWCASLASIEIPDSVTKIWDSVFSGCISLTNIMVGENNQNYKSIDGNLYNKDGTKLIQYAIGKTEEKFIIPEHVTTIESSAFYNCNNLTSVEIGNSVTMIGNSAFV